MLGKYYEYLEETNISHATFNHNLRGLKNVYNFLTIEKESGLHNVPKKMKLKYEDPNPTSISGDDFIEILKSGAKKQV